MLWPAFHIWSSSASEVTSLRRTFVDFFIGFTSDSEPSEWVVFYKWFQASVAVLVICYPVYIRSYYLRFGTTYHSHLQTSSSPLKEGIDRLSQKVCNYQSTLCNISEDQRSQFFFSLSSNHNHSDNHRTSVHCPIVKRVLPFTARSRKGKKLSVHFLFPLALEGALG